MTVSRISETATSRIKSFRCMFKLSFEMIANMSADMNGILERYPKEVMMQTVTTADREDVSINNKQSCKWPLIISILPVFFWPVHFVGGQNHLLC